MTRRFEASWKGLLQGSPCDGGLAAQGGGADRERAQPLRLDLRSLWRGPNCEIVVSRWSRAAHPVQSECEISYAAVELMRRGTFCKHVRGTTVVGDPNTAVLFNPIERFAVSHPHGEENHGITIRLAGGIVEQMAERFRTRERRAEATPFDSPCLLVPPKVHLLLRTLTAELASGGLADALEIEERTLSVVGGILGQARKDRNGKVRRARRLDACAAKRVAQIVEYLNEGHRRRLTLDEVGSVTGCSGWHAARLFRAGTGLPIHRYLMRLRLSYVLDAVAEGHSDLTRLALETGFASHSHMTAAFRRTFGAVPSVVRDRCLRRRGA